MTKSQAAFLSSQFVQNSSLFEVPNEIATAQQEIENESLKKLCYEMD